MTVDFVVNYKYEFFFYFPILLTFLADRANLQQPLTTLFAKTCKITQILFIELINYIMKLEEFERLSKNEQKRILENFDIFDAQADSDDSIIPRSTTPPPLVSKSSFQVKRELESPKTPFRGGSKKVFNMIQLIRTNFFRHLSLKRFKQLKI